MTTIEYSYEDGQPNEESYVYYAPNSINGSLKRLRKRAFLVSNVQVTDLITEGEGKKQRVVGVRRHDDEVYAKLVIIAEGSTLF